jgi:hypothetical protein
LRAITRALAVMLSCAVLTIVAAVSGIGSSAAQAATVTTNSEEIHVVLTPVESATAAMSTYTSWSICHHVVMPAISGVQTAPLDIDRCSWGVQECARQAIDGAWGSYSIVFARVLVVDLVTGAVSYRDVLGCRH